MTENKPKRCHRCKLIMNDNPALNAVAFDGTEICSECGQIESLEKFRPDLAYGLRVAQRRTQAALFGLDEKGEPKLPE